MIQKPAKNGTNMLVSLGEWSSHGSVGREIGVPWEWHIVNEFILFDWTIPLWTSSIEGEAISIWTGIFLSWWHAVMLIFLFTIVILSPVFTDSSLSSWLQQRKHYEALSKRYSSNWWITMHPSWCVYSNPLQMYVHAMNLVALFICISFDSLAVLYA